MSLKRLEDEQGQPAKPQLVFFARLLLPFADDSTGSQPYVEGYGSSPGEAVDNLELELEAYRGAYRFDAAGEDLAL